MNIGSRGLALIKEFEGYHKKLPNGDCKAYLDKLVKAAYRSPGYKGLWTIGYGCTVGVTEGLVWTEAQAEAKLLEEVAKHVKAVNAMLQKPVNQNQFDALISLSYNIGSAALARSSFIRILNKGITPSTSVGFLSFNKAGGKVVPGLVRRRHAEKRLFDEMTHTEVVERSVKLTWMQRLRMLITTSGIGGMLTWENYSEVRQYASEHTGDILLIAGILAWVTFKVLEKRAVTDYREGRWIPSGAVNVDTVLK